MKGALRELTKFLASLMLYLAPDSGPAPRRSVVLPLTA